MPCAAAPRTAAGRPRPGGPRPRRSSRVCAPRSRRRSVSADRAAALRSLPSVDQLVRRVAADPALAGLSRPRLTAAVREALDAERRRVREQSATPADADTLAARVVEGVRRAGRFSLRPVINASGAVLREVGATNRTHLRDYADAIGPGTALLLKVHTSNYRVIGFTAEVSSRELVELGRERGIAVMEDLGSGSLVDLRPWGFPYEPTVPEVVASGVDLVSFSGDKLLGGPQAGIVVGTRAIVSRLKKNPWNRALRIDKFTIAALEATLSAYEAGAAREVVPTLRLLTEPLASVLARARRVLRGVGADVAGRLGARVDEGRAQVGGGALPTVELPTAGVSLGTTDAAARALDVALRTGDLPVVGRLVEDRLFLDCRTVLPPQVAELVKAIVAAAPP